MKRHLNSIITAALVLLLSIALVSCASGNTSDETVETERTSLTVADSSSLETENGSMPPDFAGGQAPSGAPGQPPSGGMGGAPGSSSSKSITYDAVNTYDSDSVVTNKDIVSTGTDENAILVTDGNVTVENTKVTRTSSNSTGGDNSSFYGVGAAILATDGTLTVSGSEITTDAKGGAGVFAYGDSVVYVSDTTIYTTQSTSGGIHVAGGGTLYADNVTATTNGESSAAVRSDRGGGTMVVTGGSFTSNGTGSPAVYVTADISITGAELTATKSEAICIEGLNTLVLTDCDLSGDMPENSQNDCTWNIILYQSMSGDSEVGESVFKMDGGTLTAGNGGMFYSTNTESEFVIKDVEITYSESNDFFLKVTGNSNKRGWGSSGSNGADTTFTAISQEMEGDIIWDSISQLDFYMTEGSTLTGAAIDDESNAGNGGKGYCSVYIDSTSQWFVTADSTVTYLYNAGNITGADGQSVSIVGTDGTVYVQGNGAYTITVEYYSTDVSLSDAGNI